MNADKVKSPEIRDLLKAIRQLHDSGMYIGHPYIQLFADGSGCVIDRWGKDLWSFKSCEEFISLSSAIS